MPCSGSAALMFYAVELRKQNHKYNNKKNLLPELESQQQFFSRSTSQNFKILRENSWQRQLNNFSLSLSPLDLVADDPLEVHIQVNVALRAKLAEEIKENTVKVKVNSLLEICMSYSFSLPRF